jgi:uncharacterized phage protein (TIGR02218 family)
MISANAAMQTHIAGRVTSLTHLWLITRTDSQVFGFTSHNEDIEYDGVTYVAAFGFNPAAIAAGAGLAVSNTELTAVFNASYVTEEDLRAGVWDHADVRIRLINWADTSMGVMKMLRGWLGEVSYDGFQYKAELRGLADLVNRSTGIVVTPGCNAVLGDIRCNVYLSAYQATGTVSAVTSNKEFDSDLNGTTVQLTPTTTGAPTTDYFQGGKITWLTGNNAGRQMEVKTNDDVGGVELQLAMEGDIQVGDVFLAVTGCKKDRDTCRDKFGNVINFRGFPDLPGTDKVLRIGGQ